MYLIKIQLQNCTVIILCDLCKKEFCSQKHLFECKVLKSVVPELKNNESIKYEHIFGTEQEMSEVSKLLLIITKERKFLLETLND